MTNEWLTSRFLVMVLVTTGCGFSSIEENPGYCVNNGGDRFCELRGDDRIYCSMGTPSCPAQAEQAYDGCVDDEPDPSCYSPCGDVSKQFDESCLLDIAGSSEDSTSSSNATDSQSEDASDGQSHERPYPRCREDKDVQCSDPDPICYTYLPMHDFCTRPCGSADDCPMPGHGTASAICTETTNEDESQRFLCVLDCSDGKTCPLGMACVELDYPGPIYRCARSD